MSETPKSNIANTPPDVCVQTVNHETDYTIMRDTLAHAMFAVVGA